MAIKRLQGLTIEDGEPFRVNGTTYVLDGGEVRTQEQYQQLRERPRPLCALCDTDKKVHVCFDCSMRLLNALSERTVYPTRTADSVGLSSE